MTEALAEDTHRAVEFRSKGNLEGSPAAPPCEGRMRGHGWHRKRPRRPERLRPIARCPWSSVTCTHGSGALPWRRLKHAGRSMGAIATAREWSSNPVPR